MKKRTIGIVAVCTFLLVLICSCAAMNKPAQTALSNTVKPNLTVAPVQGIHFGGDPIMRNAAGDPIMLQGKFTAAGDPIMLTTLKTAGGDPIMMDIKGNYYILNAAGDPIMCTAAGDPIM